MTNASGAIDPYLAVRYADVVLLVLATPFAIALGAPTLGYLVGVGAWTVSRVIQARFQAAEGADIQRQIGMRIGGMMGGTWLVGIAILAVGLLASRADGAAAAITCLVAFTIRLLVLLLTRGMEKA